MHAAAHSWQHDDMCHVHDFCNVQGDMTLQPLPMPLPMPAAKNLIRLAGKLLLVAGVNASLLGSLWINTDAATHIELIKECFCVQHCLWVAVLARVVWSHQSDPVEADDRTRGLVHPGTYHRSMTYDRAGHTAGLTHAELVLMGDAAYTEVSLNVAGTASSGCFVCAYAAAVLF